MDLKEKQKDSWSREEVIALLEKARIDIMDMTLMEISQNVMYQKKNYLNGLKKIFKFNSMKW